MPNYDFHCVECGADFEDLVPVGAIPPCRKCHATQVAKVWRGRTPHIKQDTVPGGLTIENLGPQTMHFDSHSDYQRELKSRGLTTDRFHSVNPRGPYSTKW